MIATGLVMFVFGWLFARAAFSSELNRYGLLYCKRTLWEPVTGRRWLWSDTWVLVMLIGGLLILAGFLIEVWRMFP